MSAMKNRIGLIVLAVVALALGIALAVVIQKGAKRQEQDAQSISHFSNSLTQAQSNLHEQQLVNTNLYKDLDDQKKAFVELTNQFSALSSNLAQTSTNLAQTEVALKSSQEAVSQRDAKIADLESRNQTLEKDAQELSLAITNLNKQITDTQHKLAVAEGDKAFLQKELKRLMADKAELERQFNDINVLRAQLSKVKKELLAARHQQWAREGMLYNPDRKAGQLLMQGAGAPRSAESAKTNYDLNVELNSQGGVKIIPPTNSAPAFSPVAP